MRSILAVALVVGVACGAAFAGGPPKNQSECLERSKALEAEAERRHKATKLPIPREFARVSSNLDDFCNDNDFVKAAVTIAWMETCLSHFAKPYELGFCTRNRAYFCATYPDSDGCRGSQ